jgi:magnesium chelatase family protein
MHRILRVARTLADLSGIERLAKGHLVEALGYRALDGRRQA